MKKQIQVRQVKIGGGAPVAVQSMLNVPSTDTEGSVKQAVALEKALGVPADMWMNLQTQYNLDSAHIAERDNRKETVSVTIPVRDKDLLKEIARKFGWACML